MISSLTKKTRCLSLLFVSFCFLGICESANCQELDPQRSKAIESYENGDYVASESSLLQLLKEHEKDVIGWHYLGLTSEKRGNVEQASRAHDKAAKLGEQSLLQLVKATKNEDYIAALRPASEPIRLASISCEHYSTLNKSDARKDEWTERCLTLDDFNYVLSSAGPIYKGRDVTTKAGLLSKPQPGYLPEGLGGEARGRVILRVVFAADGRVRAIVPVQSLADKITKDAIRTARRIVFQPATLDGLPVSMWMTLEYNYNM